MPILYSLILLAALLFSFTRHRIFALCIFFCAYGTLKVMAQDQTAAISWTQLLLLRALYPILLLSLAVRLFRDASLLKQIKDWPHTYFALTAVAVLTAIYSISRHAFDLTSPFNVLGQLVIMLLFVIAASHVQAPDDFRIIAICAVLTSLALSWWILWTTAKLDFSAFRGGIEVNQNYVSLFELAGAIPLVHWLFRSNGFAKKLGIFALLAVVITGAALLESRGLLVAFAAAMLLMTPRLIPKKPVKGAVIISLALCVIMIGLYSGGMLERFSDTDLSSLNGRSVIWKYSLHSLTESGPVRMLFGFGYNSAQVLLPPAMEPGSWNYHNEYLNSLMDGGLVGLSVLLAFMISMWRKVARSTHPLQNVMKGWIVFIVVAGISGVFSGTHIFWLLLGSITGALSVEKVPSKIDIKPLFPVRIYQKINRFTREIVRDDLKAHGLLTP